MSLRMSIAATAINSCGALGLQLALDPKARITQYRHTAWRVQDGAFESAPNAITQTADGYIWIGTGFRTGEVRRRPLSTLDARTGQEPIRHCASCPCSVRLTEPSGSARPPAF